jgi:hypothetical protein
MYSDSSCVAACGHEFRQKMKCLTWNLEWKTPASLAGRLIQEQVATLDPDVRCYTEVVQTLIPEGSCLDADPDYGYPNKGGRRNA